MSQPKPPMRQKGNDMTIPRKVKDTFAATTAMMLASLNVPQNQLDAAASAYWSEIEGRGIRTITNQEPLDRVLSREQTAKIISRSRKTVSMMVAAGKLKGVFGGTDGKRLTGITESSIRAFMAK